MKTSTVIGIGVLAALGLGAYYLYTTSQATTNTTTAGTPTGSGGTTATNPTSLLTGASSLLGGLISDTGIGSDLGGIFSGSGGSQSTTTSGGNPTYSTPISTNYVQQQVLAGNLGPSDFQTPDQALEAGVPTDVEDNYLYGDQ